MTAEPDLLPCPFCGGEAHLERQGHVCCKTRFCRGAGAFDNYGTAKEQNASAVARWNTRATAAKAAEAECAQMHDAMRQATERLAAVARECEELRRDAERYRWLRDSDACSLSITHNDHHTVYVSAENTLNDDPTDYYNEVSADERQRMIDRDSIWTLHIYPNTPVGFNVYHAATLDAAIDQARGKEYAA